MLSGPESGKFHLWWKFSRNWEQLSKQVNIKFSPTTVDLPVYLVLLMWIGIRTYVFILFVSGWNFLPVVKLKFVFFEYYSLQPILHSYHVNIHQVLGSAVTQPLPVWLLIKFTFYSLIALKLYRKKAAYGLKQISAIRDLYLLPIYLISFDWN